MCNNRKYRFTLFNILLVCCLIFGSTVNVFAEGNWNVEVINSSNVSSVDSNGNVIGGGTVSFSSWMGNISYNLAKTLSEAMDSNYYLNTIWSTLNSATYGVIAQGQYLLNIKDTLIAVGGQVGDVSSKLVTTNSELNTLNGRISSISSNLTSIVSEVKLYWNTPSTTFVGLSTDGVNYSLANASGDIVYAKVTTNLNTTNFQQNDSLFKITLPIVPNIIDYVEVIVPDVNNSSVSLFLYDTNYNSTTFYCRLLNTNTVSTFIFAFHMKEGTSVQQRIRYSSSGPKSIYYTTNQYTKYYDLLADLYTLKNSQLLEDQTVAIRSLANEFNGSNGIIQDDSDTVIVVDFDSDTGEDISDFITTVKNFFSTGVSIGELTVALNRFSQMPWFTSIENYNTVNSQGAYYKDLYND